MSTGDEDAFESPVMSMPRELVVTFRDVVVDAAVSAHFEGLFASAPANDRFVWSAVDHDIACTNLLWRKLSRFEQHQMRTRVVRAITACDACNNAWVDTEEVCARFPEVSLLDMCTIARHSNTAHMHLDFVRFFGSVSFTVRVWKRTPRRLFVRRSFGRRA